MRRVAAMAAAASILLMVGCGDDDDASTTVDDSATVTTLEEETTVETPPTTADAVETTEREATTTERATTTTERATTTTAATTSSSSTTSTTVPAPIDFTPPEGGYTVTFPGQPTQLDQQATLPDGTPLPFVIYSTRTTVDGDARELGASAIPYPPGTAINLNGVINGAVAAFPGAHLISAEPIELQGRPGAQFSIDLTRGGAPQYYMSRVYTDGSTLYQLYYVGGTISPTDPNVLAFFDSLRLPEGG